MREKDKYHKAKAAILMALHNAKGPQGATQIKAAILSMGVDLQARTVRYYLKQLDEDGCTELVSRRLGRRLTEAGRTAAASMNVHSMAEIIASRVDALGYRMEFDVAKCTGSVIINVSLVNFDDLNRAIKDVQLVLDRGVSFGEKIMIVKPGEVIGGVLVPEGMAGIVTVCSITLNGVLQKMGIHVMSRFGGLLEITERRYVRFLDIIEYRGSSLDPLEVFIRADMTEVRNVVLRGSGVICASFREVPAVTRPELEQVVRRMKRGGIGGVLLVGNPGQPLLGVPVSSGYCGVIVAGGLNPAAALHEAGIKVVVKSLAGLADYRCFESARKAYTVYR